MFETSFLLLCKYLLLNIFIPFFPWLLFMWIFYGKKFEWLLLYILLWFVWVWVVAFSLFNIQFIHFGGWIWGYFIILWLLSFIFILKVYKKEESFKDYIWTLKIKNGISLIWQSFLNLSVIEKVFTSIISVYSIYFVCISWLFNFNLPTYWSDSFWNRNEPAYNIYMDDWVNLFGDGLEILWWGWVRLWYPILMPMYKVLISKFAWWINDIYFNTWERLVFLLWLLFILLVTFQKTKNIFWSVLPIWFIISLPLVFFHSYEWYMDLPLIIHCIIAAWLLYQYLESKDFDYLSLWLLFWFVASNIKNEGLVIFFPWLLCAFFIILCLDKKLKFTIKWWWKDKNNLWKSVGYFLYFLVPFLIVKFVNWLWFNQAGFEKSWMWLSDTVHREIFSHFREIFLDRDNYNLVLIALLLIVISLFAKKRKNNSNKLFLYAGLLIFLVLIAVFLFTVDYQYLVHQTAVNRLFTMSFMMVLAFSWFVFSEK